ncbi:MAG: hypothetical protein PHC53_00575 [Patescibacteria group bacterium]|nr:hypothetical protein [Patescibacteria group bacterium]
MKSPTSRQKPSKGLSLVLELGQDVKLTSQTTGSKPITAALNMLVANFQEALDVPHESYLLKDFCGSDFFKRKSGLSAETIYHKTQEGDPEGAELFVEYGSHLGALVANLERLLQPTDITIKGPMAKTFDAWGHAMGKARKQHLGKKPSVKITIA